MATTRSHRRPSRRPSSPTLGKPRGVLHPRVQQVGPEPFGIACFDCPKGSSTFLLADFYGDVRIPPPVVAHNRPDRDAAIAPVRAAFAAHDLRDGLVASERTGRDHRPVQRAFAAAGFATRRLRPFVTTQYRQGTDPANKTGDTDLAAIPRATGTGGALREATRAEAWTTRPRVIRHRRARARTGAALNGPIRDHLDVARPGFAACFDKRGDSALPWPRLRHFPTAADLRAAGVTALGHSLRQAGIRSQRRTVAQVLAGAEPAAPGDGAAGQHLRFALDRYHDRLQQNQQILRLEREIAGRLAQTPYVLVLSFPGGNGGRAADGAGAAGPIEPYATAQARTGRAGLRPARSQSHPTDQANGPPVRNCNRAPRAALLGIADNLVIGNHPFRALATPGAAQGKDPRHPRVQVAARFSRSAFPRVAGRQVFRHPALPGRHALLEKRTASHRDHDTPMPAGLRDRQAALGQVPPRAYAAEARPLREELPTIEDGRRRGPPPLGAIRPVVLARLGVGAVQSPESGE